MNDERHSRYQPHKTDKEQDRKRTITQSVPEMIGCRRKYNYA
jgi:hypothetical protein